MSRCASYSRVSTDNQAEKEYNSCQLQEEKIRLHVPARRVSGVIPGKEVY